MATVALKTLGCKLNQYESEQMREQLERQGYRLVGFEEPADVYIINSCTVTGKTDRDTRRLARRVKRLNPAAFVVVTGCYAECSPDILAAIPEIDCVCGQESKARIVELLPAHDPHPTEVGAARTDAPCSPLIQDFADHTRGFIKIQEGCDAHCTYCIIPRARGRSRSVPYSDVVAQARLLARRGHPELVLIGTHLGQFGRDLRPPSDLGRLLAHLAALPEVGRLRLSSIEPREVSPEIVALVAAGGHALAGGKAGAGKLCRHLHIPLQSGCDSVLARMKRPYDCRFYAELLHRIHDLTPLACLGADVIVGFPGETDDEFAETRQFLSALPLAYLHVFTYSPRPQTPAATMPDQIPPELKIRRNHVLRGLSEEMRSAFAGQMVGRHLEVVIQETVSPGLLSGISDNYLEVTIPGSPDLLHTIQRCIVTGTEGGTLQGRLAP